MARAADKKKEKEVVIQPQYDLTADTIETLRPELVEAIDQGASQITLDLDGVGEIDMKGVSLVISCYKSLTDTDGTLTIRTDNPEYRYIFEMLHLDKQFRIEGST